MVEYLSFGKEDSGGIFFTENCFFHLGDGFSSSFSYSFWMEEGIIKHMFPTLFSISLLQDIFVAGMGGWIAGACRWNDLGILRLSDSKVTAATSLFSYYLGTMVGGGQILPVGSHQSRIYFLLSLITSSCAAGMSIMALPTVLILFSLWFGR